MLNKSTINLNGIIQKIKELKHIVEGELALLDRTYLDNEVSKDVEEQEQKDMQIKVFTEEVERLKTYKTYTDRKIKEEATKIADDLLRDKVPQIIDERMKEFLERKNAS